MSREYLLFPIRRFVNPQVRKLTTMGALVYQHLHFQPDLTTVGTLLMNVNRWAMVASDVRPVDVDKALEELEQHGLILMDSCTQELLLTGFCQGSVLHNPNHLRGAVRGFTGVESQLLRTAIYETGPPVLRDAIDTALTHQLDALAMPSRSQSNATAIYENENENENDERAVFEAFWQQCGDTAMDEDSQRNRKRVEEAALLLAQRRQAEAPASRSLGSALTDQWARYAALLRKLASDYPGWSVRNLADAIDNGAFGITQRNA